MTRRREFDVVLWGATGATGRRVAHHLAERIGQSLRYGVTTRDEVRGAPPMLR